MGQRQALLVTSGCGGWSVLGWLAARWVQARDRFVIRSGASYRPEAGRPFGGRWRGLGTIRSGVSLLLGLPLLDATFAFGDA
jgi:hypothetical protein